MRDNREILMSDAHRIMEAGDLRCRLYVLETADGLELRAQAGDPGGTCESLQFPLKHPDDVARGMEAFANYLRLVLENKTTKTQILKGLQRISSDE